MSEILVPDLGESISEGTIYKWLVKEGDTVGQGDVLAELETDKVNLEISAEVEGVISTILRQAGENVAVGEAIGIIGAASGSTPQAAASEAEAPKAAPAGGNAVAAAAPVAAPEVPAAGGDSHAALASPGARKLARERGIDLGEVSARDPIGRIGQADVSGHGAAAPQAAAPVAPAPQGKPEPAKPAAGKATPDEGKNVERKRMSRRRLTIASRLVEAQQTAAMLTTFNEVDMTAILDIRKRRKDAFKEKHEVGLGFMSFFTKAVIGALKTYPLLNAEIDGEDLVVKKFYDIGIAVAAKEGLVVPVVRDADRLSFPEIERQIGELASKARANTLSLSELQGGTFTITNGGVFGSLLSTPILNTPQVGILGMHKIQLRPIALDEERTVNRPMMYIALSYDHRIVDGSEAVSFLVKVKELLEDPEALLLEG
ncbi:2-oxoglutarate dehydrogenase complex dihydrolipoyllysine-residue succinyltransferase [Paenibacillus sp. FSL L8-0493]|uniref:2-oxoglutarate dehydrogenase complex dihydrolipoyllysine-residue succinyltransferase n=1 Tax=unclassified Paenibacillus TaxID=185978 RepID=UPI00247697EC|nr:MULTISPECIES: 2-oxoglutarate dehydrogenase complex dihydrolipoyllysine-residue succinyltransferase [unclassified Paenibacillus]MDH6429392.1 2-oxoglutarate dehydrogenase E2 component (dihydrolipoamide succinyltransferase) [Paenibacillus sp. PastH-4]MDH6445599.1 2-oxoglutarate dehydrogenase E2 component (dihydrolipoamide succinyltransferase) [Paenibacillus sp. PastF-4]MDH6529487.1 2-oxoglutarate dehydrogenase E2 component (dihydrolipoamide succinyltransferase) [Paenibacillus sp. PastH-3]